MSAPTRYPAESWVEYLRVHAVLVGLSRASDVPTMLRLYDVCLDIGLTVAAADQITEGFTGYDTEQLRLSIEVLHRSDLRFTLIADAYEMARRAHIADPAREPTLMSLAVALAVSEAQQYAIARYIEACDFEDDSPWRDRVRDMGLALAHVAQVGACPEAVTETRSVRVRSRSSFPALVQLVREVLP